MTLILRYTHKDQRHQVYSFAIYLGSYWDAVHRLRLWRFDLYVGKLDRSSHGNTNG